MIPQLSSPYQHKQLFTNEEIVQIENLAKKTQSHDGEMGHGLDGILSKSIKDFFIPLIPISGYRFSIKPFPMVAREHPLGEFNCISLCSSDVQPMD